MVKNPGTPARAGAIKLLNRPAPVRVLTDDSGRPVAVSARSSLPARLHAQPGSVETRRTAERGAGRRKAMRALAMQAVASIDDRWKVNDEWWRGPDQEIERVYYSLLLETGHRTVVYRDMMTGEWFRQASR